MTQNSSFWYYDSEQVAEIWQSMNKLDWVVNNHQIDTKQTKMIYSKSKEETSKSSEQQDLGILLLNWTNHRGKLCNANGIKAINHLLSLSRLEEGKT